MPDLKLIVTIDTEEDDWADYARTPKSISNIERVPDLQRLFDDFRVKPTYLVDYPVAVSATAATIFGDLLKDDRCEVGAHCHPWNTPPFEEEVGKVNSMLCNLPPDLQYGKLSTLTGAIRGSFGVAPVSFRAGRWGFDGEVAKNVVRLGYRIDSSITPFVDWSEYDGPDHSGQAPGPFRIRCGEPGAADGELFEVPPTIGFLQKDFRLASRLDGLLRRKPFDRTRLIGILDRLKLLNKVWLSPELSTAGDMIRLTQVFMAQGAPFVNLTFHSASLVGGLTPFVPSKADETRFLGAIREYLSFARDEGIESIGLSMTLDWSAEDGRPR